MDLPSWPALPPRVTPLRRLCARFVDATSTFPALRRLCARFVDATCIFPALKRLSRRAIAEPASWLARRRALRLGRHDDPTRAGRNRQKVPLSELPPTPVRDRARQGRGALGPGGEALSRHAWRDCREHARSRASTFGRGDRAPGGRSDPPFELLLQRAEHSPGRTPLPSDGNGARFFLQFGRPGHGGHAQAPAASFSFAR